MLYLYILSALITETQNSDSFNALIFKDMGMLSYYHMLGYRVYLVIEVSEQFVSELNLMWLELDLTYDDVQTLLDICICNGLYIYKNGIDFL